ncbi:hypothetical protein M0R45_000112 [Rubus argutus]|uniref:KIB1-4 beta-propeller domain-containing protein n=1 Tax=Rubus argutus TaxID=59490 RepID=A0AAW1VML0_RUBAR
MDVECRLHPKSWSKLQSELLGFITTKLGSVDVIRFRAVCNCWKRAATSYISSPGHKLMPQTLMLMIPSGEKKDAHTRRFFNLAENKTFTLKNVFRDFSEAWCVGSSHGWLVLMDEMGKLDLFNPFSGDRIELPSIWTLTHFVRWETHPNFSDVFSSNKNSVRGDESEHYYDIMFHNDHLYALASGGSVGVWDFTKSLPTNTFNLDPFADQSGMKDFPVAVFDVLNYLVESLGDLLFVKRFVVKTTVEGKTFPYRTLHFHIFRLSSTGKEWEKVEYLHDRALFLGGNLSMSISCCDFAECQENSIYFTDDNYYEMNLKYLADDEEDKYVGHDLGVYNLKNKVVKPMSGYQFFDKWTIYDPLPFWIVPNPWPSSVIYGAPSSSSLSGPQA